MCLAFAFAFAHGSGGGAKVGGRASLWAFFAAFLCSAWTDGAWILHSILPVSRKTLETQQEVKLPRHLLLRRLSITNKNFHTDVLPREVFKNQLIGGTASLLASQRHTWSETLLTFAIHVSPVWSHASWSWPPAKVTVLRKSLQSEVLSQTSPWKALKRCSKVNDRKRERLKVCTFSENIECFHHRSKCSWMN